MNKYQISKGDFITLLQHLLKGKVVSEILSGAPKKNRYTIKPELVSDPAKLTDFPLSQLYVYGYGRTDSASNTLLHSHVALEKKVGVIARPCDVRAMVELEKKIQLTWDNLFVIMYEDIGYITVNDLRKFFKKEGIKEDEIIHENLTGSELILKMKDGKVKKYLLGKDINITANCTRCVNKSHPLADISIGNYGLDPASEEYLITPNSKQAKEIIAKLGWESKVVSDAVIAKYDEVAGNLIKQCKINREKDLAAWKENPNKLDLLAKCTGCGMCVTSCPVCFCVSCNLLDGVKKKTMDKFTFVTTRFSHVGDTCVECGRCAANCPVKIPLTLVFQTLRDKFKERSGYEAGAKRNEQILHLDV